jgi:hypothetical protein
MCDALDILADGTVSRRLANALPTIMSIFRTWEPALHAVEIHGAVPARETPQAEGRVGTFFTGGVDSFYTFLKHHDEITDLIYVHGFDVGLDVPALYHKVSVAIEKVAAEFNKRFIRIESNLGTLLNAYVDWGPLGHGAALATIGHLLSADFRLLYIPATHTYADMYPWGSHPLLDPLWSSDVLEFKHDGCEATRVQKVKFISEFDVALRNLRVCIANPDLVYNCGQCEKCLRTMINLHLAGALERCTTFKGPIRLDLLRRIRVYDDNTRSFVLENLAAIGNDASNRDLRRALRAIMRRTDLRRGLKLIGNALAGRASGNPISHPGSRRFFQGLIGPDASEIDRTSGLIPQRRLESPRSSRNNGGTTISSLFEPTKAFE